MSDKSFTPSVPAIYAAMMGLIVDAARPLGYAVAPHGSLARDLDLIAVPWLEDAESAEDLVEAICSAVGGVVAPSYKMGDGRNRNPAEKPHGRRAWTIILGGGPFIDLSVMPRVEGKQKP